MDKFIEIEGIEINISKAVRRVKKDIEDDWFKDPFMFEDYLTDDFIIDKIQTLDVNSYSTTRKEYFDIPKPGFVIRYSIETNIIDRVLYQALIDVFAGSFDSILGVQIYSHRVTKDKDRDNYFFMHPVEQWNAFNNDYKIVLEQKPSNCALITDLTNFYENINVDTLKDKLNDICNDLDVDKAQKDVYLKAIKILYIILKKWAVTQTGCGIPQNRNPSSFLANMYLHVVDEAMIRLGYRYYRYMDDIRFVCDSKYEARKILKHLISELRKIGLNVNSKKTAILGLDAPEIINFLPMPDREIEQIDELFKTRKLNYIKKALPLLEKKTIGIIEAKDTGSRYFRFCIQRYIKLLRTECIKESVDTKMLVPTIITELLEQPWSTDSFFQFLECVELTEEDYSRLENILSDEVLCTYEWQSYYLWQLLIAKKYKSEKLLGLSRHKIKNEQNNKPQTAGCCLYLSSLGTINDKQYIAENFIIFKDFFTQRIALIAVKDLSYSKFIVPYVKDLVLPEYIGSYRELKNRYPDIFYIPPKPIHFKDLYNELPEIIS
jgi:hypothetical protein